MALADFLFIRVRRRSWMNIGRNFHHKGWHLHLQTVPFETKYYWSGPAAAIKKRCKGPRGRSARENCLCSFLFLTAPFVKCSVCKNHSKTFEITIVCFRCPCSSVSSLGDFKSVILTDCHFRIWTQRVTFKTWDPTDIWSGWCQDRRQSCIMSIFYTDENFSLKFTPKNA